MGIGALAVVFAVFMAATRSSRKAASATPRAGGATTAAARSAPAQPPVSLPPLAPKDLATADLLQWRSLEAPGRVGSYAAFDPGKNLAWARSMAAAWKADAYLYELHVSQATKDGTIDLSGPRDRLGIQPWVQYWFASGACRSTGPGCGLTFQLLGTSGPSGAPSEPVLNVMSTQGATSGELRDPKCTLRQALAALDKAGWLPSAPTYDVDLTDPKWAIGFQERSKGSIGVVSSITCAAAPK
jgi:hypothetical protein